MAWVWFCFLKCRTLQLLCSQVIGVTISCSIRSFVTKSIGPPELLQPLSLRNWMKRLELQTRWRKRKICAVFPLYAYPSLAWRVRLLWNQYCSIFHILWFLEYAYGFFVILLFATLVLSQKKKIKFTLPENVIISVHHELDLSFIFSHMFGL